MPAMSEKQLVSQLPGSDEGSGSDYSDESGKEDLSSQDLTVFPAHMLDNHGLTQLFMDYNDLEQLPQHIGTSLPNLEIFSAIGNNLTSLPNTFGNMVKLKEIYLNENRLVKLSDTVCCLKCLEKLQLTGNQLEYLPEKFGEIQSLRSFTADENLIQKLPKTFGLLENLEELELSCNSLSVILDGIGMLKSLKVLNLSSNKLTVLPESFGNLPNLQALDLSANNIKFLPNKFHSCHCLEKLYADTNLLQVLPEWVSSLSNILEFSVKDNQFQAQTLSDTFPPNCKRLKHLDMSGNFMSKLPDSLGELQNLEFLHFGSVIGELERRNFQNGNWLPNIPDSVCELRNLRELYLDENQLTSLPEDFGNLCSLQTLDLGQNRIHELPESFGQLCSLRVCMLSKNHLQLLPSNFGDLCSLEDIRLDDNEIAELPESFSKLSKLKTLDLFCNRLREVPTVLRDLTSLVRLDVEGNDFHVPLTEVPQIVTKSKYPARDPNLKDNWRGRARQDLSNIDDQIIQIEDTELNDFEPPPPDLNFSEDVLHRAMRQSLSLWKSHRDSSASRRKPRRPRRRHYSTDEDDVDLQSNNNSDNNNDDDVDDYDEDDNFEPPIHTKVVTWSGSVKKESDSSSRTSTDLDKEDWDAEIEASMTEFDAAPVYTHPVFQYYPPVENGKFTFAAFDIHQPDYVKRPLAYPVEENQFDNCDTDQTEEINVDPIF